jgi:hypothetical protein
VGHDQDRDALSDIGDGVAEGGLVDGVQLGGGFVQEQEPGTAEQAAMATR